MARLRIAVLYDVWDDGGGEAPSEWTLRISPFDGSMKVLEGTVKEGG